MPLPLAQGTASPHPPRGPTSSHLERRTLATSTQTLSLLPPPAALSFSADPTQTRFLPSSTHNLCTQPAALIQTAPLPKQTAPLPRLRPDPCQPLQCQVHLLLALLTPAAAASTPAPDRIAFPALQLLRNHPIITAVFVTILLTLAALAMYYLASRTTITITAQNDIEKVELGLACAATLKDAAPKTIETVELGLADAGIPDLEGLRLPATYLTDMGGNPVDHRRQCQIANRNMPIDAYKNHAPARLLPGEFNLIPNTTNLTWLRRLRC